MITAPKSGAEVIPFIKTYVNLPTAIVSEQFPLTMYNKLFMLRHTNYSGSNCSSTPLLIHTGLHSNVFKAL